MKAILVVCAVLLAMPSVRMRCSAQFITLTGQGGSQNGLLGCGEKQLALELHNFLRASQQAANMRQLVSA